MDYMYIVRLLCLIMKKTFLYYMQFPIERLRAWIIFACKDAKSSVSHEACKTVGKGYNWICNIHLIFLYRIIALLH